VCYSRLKVYTNTPRDRGRQEAKKSREAGRARGERERRREGREGT